MKKTLNSSESEIGLVWLSGFLPHLSGVYLTVMLIKHFGKYQWLYIMLAIILEGLSCLTISFITNLYVLMIPICVITFSYGIIDSVILPTMAYLVDSRHGSVYGSVYAIVDVSYSVCYAFGPMISGVILHFIGFFGLTIITCSLLVLFTPFLFFLRKIYYYKLLDESNKASIY